MKYQRILCEIILCCFLGGGCSSLETVKNRAIPSGGAGTGNPYTVPGTLVITDSATNPPIQITERSSAPSSPSTGDLYLDDGTNCDNTTTTCWKRYTGSVWEELGDPSTYSPITIDTVLYAPETGDTTAIDIEAGGQFTLADGTIKTFSATNLDIDDDWTTDNSVAVGWGSIWSNGTTTKFSTSETSCPSDVSNGVKIRGGVSIYDDSGTKRIRQFVFDGDWYVYLTEIEVFSGTAPTTSTQLDLSDYCPFNITFGRFIAFSESINNNYEQYIYYSLDGGYAWDIWVSCVFWVDAADALKRSFRGVFLGPTQQTFYWKSDLAFASTTLDFQAFQMSSVSDGTSLGGSDNGELRWSVVTGFSRSDDDTITIAVDDCTDYGDGVALRFSADSSTWYYAIVDGCTDNGSNISVDIDGAPFSTSRDDYLQRGIPEVVKSIQLIGVGNAPSSLGSNWFPKYLWGGSSGYFVRIYIYVDTAPTGSALTGNVEINGTNALDTEFSIAASGTSTDSGITLDDTTYSNTLIEQDKFVEIDISQIGSTIPGGSNAWAKLYFIIP